MTITDSGISKEFDVGDTLNIVDLFTLGGTLDPGDYDQVYASLIIDAIGESSSNEFSNITIDQLDNLNLAADSDVNNPKIRFKGYGEYKFIFYTIDFFTTPTDDNKLTVTVTVDRPVITFRFKTAPTPDLGTCSEENCDVIDLGFSSTASEISSTFNVFMGGSQVTSSALLADIFADVTGVSFSLIYDSVVVKNGATYTITEPGTYYLDIYSYTSTVFIVQFVILSVVVAPVSYASVRFTGPISINYGNMLPSIYGYLTEDPISTPSGSITVLSEPTSTTTKVILVDGFTSGSGISNVNEYEIPNLSPGMYILKATLNGSTIYGFLDIDKGDVEIYNSLETSYTIGTTPTTITFATAIYVIRRITNSITSTVSGVTVTFANTFTPADGSSPSSITTSTYTMDIEGTLEIIATFAGNSTYKATSERYIINIGPVPVDVALNKNYFITRSELTTSRITGIEADMINNMTFTNRLTGISLTTEEIAIIKNNISILYDDTTAVSRTAIIYYRTTTSSVQSDLLTSTEIVDYINITDVLLPKLIGAADSVSIKGIQVLDGSQITLNYTKSSVNYNVTLTKNNTGDVYAIDSEDDTDSITFVSIKDSSNNDVVLTTSELEYLDDIPQHHTDIEDIPNGLYRALVQGGASLASSYTFTTNTTEHIVLTDTVVIEIDIINYLLDRIGATSRDITYLMESPHLIYNDSVAETDYKISSSYLTVKIGSVTVPSALSSDILVTPDLTVLAAKSDLQDIENIPLTSGETYLDVYNGSTKLTLTRSYTLVLPKMVISGVESDIEVWFDGKGVVFGTPVGVTADSTIADKVNATYTETVNTDNTESVVTTVITNYEAVETIVLDDDSTDTSRPFWLSLINKLTAFKAALTTAIKADPEFYLTNTDITNADFSSSMLSIYEINGGGTLDLEDFGDNVETFTGHLESLPDTYDKLVSNEVNTIILKKHILASMVIIKKALINFISIRYTSGSSIPAEGTYSLTGLLKNQTITFVPDSFSGTYGTVNATIVINTPYANIPTLPQTYIYTYWVVVPITISLPYTNSSDESTTATFTLVTDNPGTNIATGAVFNNQTAITAATATNAEVLLENVSSSMTFKYTASNIVMKGSAGITVNDSNLFHGTLKSQFTFNIKKYRSNVDKCYRFNSNLITDSTVNATISQLNTVTP